MGSPRVAPVVLLAALLLAPPLAAQGAGGIAWDELAGGAARTGAAFLPSATLDVLGARDLFANGTEIELQYSKGLVATPHGLLALAQRVDACVLLRILEEGVEERVLDGCEDGTLTAYDRVNDRILVCSTGDAEHPVLQARDAATGKLAWGVRPVQILPAPEPAMPWDCRGTALATGEGAAVVAMWGGQGAPVAARIVRVELESGEVAWQRRIGAADFYRAGRPFALPGAEGGFIPFGVSLTESGIVVSGRVTCPCGKGDPLGNLGAATTSQGAVAWLDRNGVLVGAALAEDKDGAPSMRWYGQWWATTQGPLAAFALGERVLVVNPSEQRPVREAPFRGIETGRGYSGIIPSAWWGDVILVPIAKSVTAVDARTLEPRWSRTLGDEWVVSALLVVPPSDALVLVAHDAPRDVGDEPAVLHRLDLETGNELQRIPLPGTIRTTTSTGRAGFQPQEDGRLLVYSLDGRLITLGPAPADAAPRLDVDDAYPAPGAPVTVRVASPASGATYVIAWGDGAVEAGGTSWTHRFGEDAPRTARVTALHADGRTATAEVVLRVGATPPPQLTPLQRAFAPERQDLTFGVLGVALTLVGAGIAILSRRRRHGRLHEELTRLERIREEGRRDPESALRALGAFRERILADVGAKRLDDAQLNTLDARANVVFAALRMRVLGPLAGRLSADFRHALDVVLHDGVVEPHELATLRAALEMERDLSAEARARLWALLERLAQRG